MPQFQTVGPAFTAREALSRLAQIKNERDEFESDCKRLENQNALLAYALRCALARLTDGTRFQEMLDTVQGTIEVCEVSLAHADCGFDEVHIMEAA